MECRDYRERWTVIKRINGGGQGHAFKVESRELPGVHRFLKVLKEQTNAERRGRMFREAAALSTYSFPFIPKLIESNAHRHEEKDFQLYAVTEWVEGAALSAAENHPISIERAVGIVTKLAETLRYVHRQGDGHRDVKPDNVILANDGQTPYLVDFGMTFNVDRHDVFDTGDWQELGNRFLRLPELSAYSSSKGDHRSDLTFLTGVFYYLLFGRVPSVLQDEKGRLPHQRPDIDLERVCGDYCSRSALLSLFDRGFQLRAAERFQTAGEFLERIDGLTNSEQEDDVDAAILRLRARFSEDAEQRERLRSIALSGSWQKLSQAIDLASKYTDGLFMPTQSGTYNPNTDAPYRNMGLHHHYREHLMRFWLRVTCHFVGSELVVTAETEDGADRREYLRTDAEDPDLGLFDMNAFVARLIRGASEVPSV